MKNMKVMKNRKSCRTMKVMKKHEGHERNSERVMKVIIMMVSTRNVLVFPNKLGCWQKLSLRGLVSVRCRKCHLYIKVSYDLLKKTWLLRKCWNSSKPWVKVSNGPYMFFTMVTAILTAYGWVTLWNYPAIQRRKPGAKKVAWNSLVKIEEHKVSVYSVIARI